MKKSLLHLTTLALAALLALACTTQESSDYPYRNVDFSSVQVTDHFLAPRINTIATVTVPFAFHKCEETGRINNFAVAGGLVEGHFSGRYPFDDSDVFKIMEGASYLLAVNHDEALDAYMDSLIMLVAAAQEEDGYLYTNRTINNPPHRWIGAERWSNEWDNSHETYNVGHMYEAAVAHYLATGKRTFLDVAIKNADLLCSVFNENGLCIAPGHEEVELALVKLYRVTGNSNYLNLSRYFLESRGRSTRFDKESKDMFRNGKYWQDHMPVVDQRAAVGHAVRGTYLYSAMADVAALLGDAAYRVAADSIWNDLVSRKMYLTGGLGSSSHGESYGDSYELPNKSAYCETCAAIGCCFFAQRMFMMYGDASYVDVLERAMYNGVLSGIDLKGDRFFYPNPLEVGTEGQARSEWFDCSCCPSNLSRFIPAIPGYVYATGNNSLYVNLFASSSVTAKVNGRTVSLTQETEYPWNGQVRLTLHPEKNGKFALNIRIPGYVGNSVVPSDLYRFAQSAEEPQIDYFVNGEKVSCRKEKGYAVLERNWKDGDVVTFEIPLQPKTVLANEAVEADRGLVAVECGPIVYCAEFADNDGFVSNCIVKSDAKFSVNRHPELFDGVNVLTCPGEKVSIEDGEIKVTETPVNFIPFYARSHRGEGEMQVWMPMSSDGIESAYRKSLNIVDFVLTGNLESENRHGLKGVNTHFGGSADTWRDAENGWFSYRMKVAPDAPMQVVITYFSKDGGNRLFDILVDGEKIGEQQLRTETFTAMIERPFPIPDRLTKGKKEVTVMFRSHENCIAGGIFGCRTEKY